MRVNTAYHGGGTEVDKEDNSLGLASIALDYRGDQLRLSGDLGYNNNRLKENRPSLRLTNAVASVPSASQYADYHGHILMRKMSLVVIVQNMTLMMQ